MPSEAGLLLVNLGTPLSTEPADIRSFLDEFLMDGRVITLPWPLRALLVKGLIVPRRWPLSQAKYRRIWGPGGSPLLVHSAALLAGLRQALGPGVRVELGMRYAEPSMAAALDRLEGVASLTVLPLFPQFAEATTGSVFAKLDELLASRPALAHLPQARIADFHAEPFFIQAFARSVRRRFDPQAMDQVVFSFHGLPLKDALRVKGCQAEGDCCAAGARSGCYVSQAKATAKALAAELGLGEGRWRLAFQSRLGRAEWVKPYFSETVESLARSGVKRLGVACPSFVADCLETLEEVGIDNLELFHEHGGEDYALAECPNSEPQYIAEMAGWLRGRLA